MKRSNYLLWRTNRSGVKVRSNNANLKEEYEKEMQEQDEMDMEQLYAEVEDLKHESVGLTALSSFENGSLF